MLLFYSQLLPKVRQLVMPVPFGRKPLPVFPLESILLLPDILIVVAVHHGIHRHLLIIPVAQILLEPKRINGNPALPAPLPRESPMLDLPLALLPHMIQAVSVETALLIIEGE